MTAREQLEQLEKLRADGTPGEWKRDGTYVVRGRPIADTSHLAPTGSQADAILIAEAVNALPKHTAALRAVLELADELDQSHDGTDVAHTIRAAITEALDSP